MLTIESRQSDIKAHKHIGNLIRDGSLIGSLLESGVYGSEVDVFLLSGTDWIIRTGKNDLQLMDMVLAGRADYSIVPEMQWREAQHVSPMALNLIEVPDFGTYPSYPIYIACSPSLPRKIFDLLDTSMKTLGYKPGVIPR